MTSQSNFECKPQRGFTVIEIAIVLVIIGLLLGGVLQGQKLLENSRVKSAINSFNGIAASVFSYQDRYGQLPGDDGDTATLAARGDSWTNAVGGNVDGLVDAAINATFTGAGESGGFFQHLRAAALIAGDPSQSGPAALPENPFGGLIGITTATINDGLDGTKICMSRVNGASAIALDRQLDDGNGANGRLRSTVSDGTDTSPATGNLAQPYSEDNIYTVCYRI